MKKVSILIFSLTILLGACAKEKRDAEWHKYAIETCCIPEGISLKKVFGEDESKLTWYLQFHSLRKSTITKATNEELLDQIAKEHGEDGSGFYAISPTFPCVYGVQKIEVVGCNGGREASLSHLVTLSSLSIEPFIRRGYKNADSGMWTPFDLPLDRITNYDYMPFPNVGYEFTITCNRSDVEGKFDRLEIRVILKDGKVLHRDMLLK